MTIAARKTEELSQKAAAFGRGVDQWLAERRARVEFQIHTSQLNAIEALLSGVHAGITGQLDSAVKKGAVLAQAMNIENMILAGYQVWEFYRPKLAQRLESQFRDFLRIADEFAWLCYRPVRDAVFGKKPEAKEPPLVYLNAAWSPFLKERNRRYRVEGAPDVLLARQPDFQKAVAKLPFPVIGVPWYQAGFLPGGLTIAHEVGHAVVADCGLHDRLIAAVGGVQDATQRQRWEDWAEEMFADAYGCLSAGPAFAFSLADTLSADRATVNVEQETNYPSHSLRIWLNCALLRQTDYAERAAELWKQWSTQYPEPYPWSAYKDDVEAVAQGLLNVPLSLADGQTAPLRKLIQFPATYNSLAKKFEDETKANTTKTEPELRVMWAAARNAYDENPAAFAGADANDVDLRARFGQRMRAACLDNLRSGETSAGKDRLRYLKELGQSFTRDVGPSQGGEGS